MKSEDGVLVKQKEMENPAVSVDLTKSRLRTKLKCEVCGSGKADLPYVSLPAVHRCLSCGFVFLFPQPSLDELKSIYDENYFLSERSSSKGYDNYLRDEDNIRRTFRKRFHYIDRFFEKPGRVLDVGCATGFFLDEAKKKGWEPRGIEISEFGAHHTQKLGIDVFCGSLEDFGEPTQPFDLVTMWDVIEHVPNPRLAVERINQLLRPGGCFVLATPAIDSFPAKWYRDKWMGFKDEEHLFFFSRDSLTRLLTEAGFEVRMCKFEGKHISFDLFKRRLGLYQKKLSGFLRKLFPPSSKKSFNFYMNPFDIHLMVAEKVRDHRTPTVGH